MMDPLTIHDGEQQKSDMIVKAMKRVRNMKHVFQPSLYTAPSFMWGHGQSILTGLKQMWIDNMSSLPLGQIGYDKREIFTLSDGGEICLDFKLSEIPKPMLFIITG